jgi:hypothetical protein
VVAGIVAVLGIGFAASAKSGDDGGLADQLASARLALPGARYGSFPAACHYVDGTFVPADTQERCARRNPQSGAKFNFWHGPLMTLHVWVWYPHPDGLFATRTRSSSRSTVTPPTRGLAPVPSGCEHVFVMIVCVLLPRFPLAVAAGGREVLASGPVAVAP